MEVSATAPRVNVGWQLCGRNEPFRWDYGLVQLVVPLVEVLGFVSVVLRRPEASERRDYWKVWQGETFWFCVILVISE